MNFEKFLHKKVQVEKEGYTYYYWYLINKKEKNGVHFHGAKQHDLETFFTEGFNFNNNQYGFVTHGIERHSTKPIYEGQKPLKNCDVTGEDCYCSGTSLYASENLGHIDPDNSDNFIWAELYYLYSEWFEKK